MTIREIKELNRLISTLSHKKERIKAEMLKTSPVLSGLPGTSNGSHQDKIGKCVAEISDLETRIAQLKARRESELSRLSKDIDEENCIYLFLVENYTWLKIAQITDGRLDTVNSIKKRCYRHEW